jgi:hypothetical protein
MALYIPSQIGGEIHIKSDNIANAGIPVIAADVTLGTLTIPSDLVVTPRKVFVDLVLTEVFNAGVGSGNKTDGAQIIQVKKDAGAYHDAITVPLNSLVQTASARQQGLYTLPGTTDIIADYAGGSVLTFKWVNAKASLNNFEINNFHFVLRLIF